ncbi:MAG: hypothetical protein JWO67_5741 [Streptosporangiaceae bacterium]|jgi:hypothetical protein|nr:hypothetical protein [Streptosporangiaceae bacterium]
MKESKKAQILLPPVTLAAVLSMSGIASASPTEYVQATVPSTNAAQFTPSDNGDDNGDDKNDDKNDDDGDENDDE